MTLSVAILVSLVVSLTVTPMLCARWLRRRHVAATHDDGSRAGGAFGLMHRGYAQSLGWALNHPALTAVHRVRADHCQRLAVSYDSEGLLSAAGHRPDDRWHSGRSGDVVPVDEQQAVSQFVEIVKKDPAVAHVTAFTGGGQRNSGFMFVVLKPTEGARAATADEISNRWRSWRRFRGIAVPAVGAGLARRWSIRQCAIPVHSCSRTILRCSDNGTPAIRATLSNLTGADRRQHRRPGQRACKPRCCWIAMRWRVLGITVRNVDATLNDA